MVKDHLHWAGVNRIIKNVSLYLSILNDMNTASADRPNRADHDNPLMEIRPEDGPKLYTLGEYLRKEERSRVRHEYFNGIIQTLPMAKGPHNIIAMNVGTALNVTLKATGKKYIVFSSQQKIYLPELNFGLYPDVLVVCEAPEYYDDEQLLLTNPLLIVEVLSKSTRKYDSDNKFSYYKTLPSFQEYVLIEQNECRAETWYREGPDLWRNTIVAAPDGRLPMRSVGCELLLADVYEHIEFPARTAGRQLRNPKK